MKQHLINDRKVLIWTDQVEASAMAQIENLARLPFLYHHLAVMPDVHAGMGMPIGGVLATKNVVVPNAVGVDIGCGMCAVKTNKKATRISPAVMRKQILRAVRNRIPMGKGHHKAMQDEAFLPQGHDIERMHVVREQYNSARRQVGTLGGGNHFIEFQRDTDGYLWIMIHSGSRNLGKQVGDYYNMQARRLNELYYATWAVDMRLPFLPVGTDEFTNYWREMKYCIDFALCNRRLMMTRIEEVLKEVFPRIKFEPMINIAHNYAAWETHFGEKVIVHRKGATLAQKGTVGIIPGSQGTSSYIVEGLGNPLSFCSCSHGAGRTMSRTQAIATLSLRDEIARLEARGIIHAIRGQHSLDEAPSAYKDIDEVIRNELDLVKVTTRLEPLACIKA